MKISYNKLFKLLIDKNLKRKDLCKSAQISDATMAKLGKGANINTEILYKYTQSSLFKELKEAKEIHKEEPFYINLSAKDIFDEAADNEMILVQGIIDLYYIDKNGNLILVDYKTDYVLDGNLSKLEEKYKIQLE